MQGPLKHTHHLLQCHAVRTRSQAAWVWAPWVEVGSGRMDSHPSRMFPKWPVHHLQHIRHVRKAIKSISWGVCSRKTRVARCGSCRLLHGLLTSSKEVVERSDVIEHSVDLSDSGYESKPELQLLSRCSRIRGVDAVQPVSVVVLPVPHGAP